MEKQHKRQKLELETQPPTGVRRWTIMAAARGMRHAVLRLCPNFVWPSTTPTETKTSFLYYVGELSYESTATLIAMYLLTWEDLNAQDDINPIIFNQNHPFRMEHVTRVNLAFCNIFEPKDLRATPFENLSSDEYSLRVHKLCQKHEANLCKMKID
jgi:hypothetical protein